MNSNSQQALYEFLCEYLTPARQETIERVVAQRTNYLTVVVEDLYLERNGSAVARTCECFGLQEVHIIENAHKYKLSKGMSRGAQYWMDIHMYDRDGHNTQTCLQSLKAKGYRLAVADPGEQSSLLKELDLDQPTAFVFGAERDGLSEVAREMGDIFFKIPMAGVTESFNVSVAAALVLYEMTDRLRKRTDIEWQLPPDVQLEKKIQWAKRVIKNVDYLVDYFYEKQSKQL